MPSHLKNLVRARRERTGESYEQALRHVRAQEESDCKEAAPDSPPRDERHARSRSVADTAFSIAVVRADEGRHPPGERLFEDPYAALFAAAGAHAADSTQRFLDLPGFYPGVRMRTRFVDDAVRDGLAGGLQQVVLLGAGFDARGMRMPEIGARGATVYEVDTPEQLARKRTILAGGGIKVPAHIRYVPFDFDEVDLSLLTVALEEKGFRRRGGAMFVWEGVIGYIADDVIDRTLRFIADEGGPGTRVVFTYGKWSFDPDTAATRTRRMGFRACEELGGDELWRGYLKGEPFEGSFVMRLGVATV
jgi:methyltransferase (TIGR00027 family)